MFTWGIVPHTRADTAQNQQGMGKGHTGVHRCVGAIVLWVSFESRLKSATMRRNARCAEGRNVGPHFCSESLR